MYTQILISTDGSELTQKGIDYSLSLAKAMGSKVTVITATEPFPIIYGREWQPTPEVAKHFEQENASAAAAILEKVKADADKVGVPLETVHSASAFAAEAILDAAKERGCNLIVMSSHGRTGLGKMLLGSQTSKVVSRSVLPVLVVR